jgi:hypothetical protein
LSTTAASIAGTLAVSGNATFDTTTLVVDAANNRVGVGTASPDHPLQVNGNVLFKNSLNNALAFFAKESDDSGTLYLYNNGTLKNVIASNANSYFTGGNVGIGTSAPSQKLQVVGTVAAQIGIDGSDATGVRIYGSGTSKRVDFTAADAGVNERISGIGTGGVGVMTFSVNNDVGTLTERVRIQTAGGISFNGDTAQANALDDYEEGTFTPTIIGTTTAGTATYGGGQSGLYTKIGRMVYVSIYLSYSGGTGTGDLRIAGLPFTIAAADVPSFSIGAMSDIVLTALNVPVVSGVPSATQLSIQQLPVGGGTQTSVTYDGTGVIVMSGFYQV